MTLFNCGRNGLKPFKGVSLAQNLKRCDRFYHLIDGHGACYIHRQTLDKLDRRDRTVF